MFFLCRLPDNPTSSSGSDSTTSSPHSSPFQRRNATRVGSLSARRNTNPMQSQVPSSMPSQSYSSSKAQAANVSPELVRKSLPASFKPMGKGPTIRLTSHDSPMSSPSFLETNPPGPIRSRSPSARGTFIESEKAFLSSVLQ